MSILVPLLWRLMRSWHHSSVWILNLNLSSLFHYRYRMVASIPGSSAVRGAAISTIPWAAHPLPHLALPALPLLCLALPGAHSTAALPLLYLALPLLYLALPLLYLALPGSTWLYLCSTWLYLYSTWLYLCSTWLNLCSTWLYLLYLCYAWLYLALYCCCTSALPGSTSPLPGSTSALPGSTSALPSSTSALPGVCGDVSTVQCTSSILPHSQAPSKSCMAWEGGYGIDQLLWLLIISSHDVCGYVLFEGSCNARATLIKLNLNYKALWHQESQLSNNRSVTI